MWNSSEISSEISGQGVKTRVYFALKFYLLLNMYFDWRKDFRFSKLGEFDFLSVQ